MKRQLKQTGILAAGLFCATQALAGWTDVADEKELRAVQASSTFHGQDIYGRGFTAAFEQDGSAKVDVGGALTARGSAQVVDLDADGNPDTVVALPFADRIAIVENPDGGFVRLVEYQRRGPLGDAHYFVTPLADAH